MMKKLLKDPWFLVLLSTYLIFLLLLFLLPFDRGAVFWISLLFSTFAFGIQLYTIPRAIGNKLPLMSRYYGFPIARVSLIYGFIQILLSLVFCAAGARIPLGAVLIVDLILFLLAFIGYQFHYAARNFYETPKRSGETKNMDEFRRRARTAAINAEGRSCEGALKRLCEDLHSSDPVYTPLAEKQDELIRQCLDELESSLEAGNDDAVAELCAKCGRALRARNEIVYAGK